jgi:hypothetical protein
VAFLYLPQRWLERKLPNVEEHFLQFSFVNQIVAKIKGMKRCFYKLSTHNNSVHESINHNLIKIIMLQGGQLVAMVL